MDSNCPYSKKAENGLNVKSVFERAEFFSVPKEKDWSLAEQTFDIKNKSNPYQNPKPTALSSLS